MKLIRSSDSRQSQEKVLEAKKQFQKTNKGTICGCDEVAGNGSIHSPKLEYCPRKEKILYHLKGLNRVQTTLYRPENGLDELMLPRLPGGP